MSTERTHVSLLRTEALDRASHLSVTAMLVELDLTAPGDTFSSTSTITFDAAAGASTFVDFKGVELRSATLNGQVLPADIWANGRIPLGRLDGHNTLVVDGLMAYSVDGEGLHRHIDPADGQTYLYAMSFLDAASRWFACFDQPDLKSPYELRVTAPAEWTVLGNGPGESLGPGRWRIVQPRPLSTYFVTLVAGPYASVLDEHDGIALGFHARASLKDALDTEAADLVEVTKACFDYYHRVFGVRYPFGEYHQAFVPDFNAGAMENPGCVTLRDAYIFRARATAADRGRRAGTIAHEMAHMWFGDLVTMRWWSDLWLNESFAEYMAHRACAEVTRYPLWTEFGIVRKDWGSIADQAPSTHPVAGTSAVDAAAALADFDGISYAKGAAVLKQLVAHLSDPVFFDGLSRYFGAHAFSNAEFADLLAAWTAAGAVDLDSWAQSWLRTTGMDTIDVARGHRSAMITRTPPPGQDVVRAHALTVGAVHLAGGAVLRTEITLDGVPVGIDVPNQPILLVPDAADDTWAKIRFGLDGWRLAGAALPLVTAASTRVVIYNSIRDAVRNAELAPTEALELICDSIVGETSDVVVKEMLTFAQKQLAGPSAAPAVRASRRARVHQAAAAILSGSTAGSDRQLTAFRVVVGSCNDAGLLGSWLESVGLPAGLSLDPELVWAIVVRLSALAPDEDRIEAALRRDPSAAAHVHAAQARAALPTETAKQAAWQLITQPSHASAYELYATAKGFFDPDQTELTAPFVGRYFAEIGGTADFRTGWVLAEVAKRAFPGLAVTAETVALADETLREGSLDPALHRALTDCADALRRAAASLLLDP